MENYRILTLLGKVDPKVLKKMNKVTGTSSDNSWYFVDYTTENIKNGEKFDTLLSGKNKSLVPQGFKAQIENIYDQFGTSLKMIEKGFQTIVHLKFIDAVPKIISDLPPLTEWQYNQDPVFLAKHEDISLAKPDLFIHEIDKYIVIELKKELISKNSLPKASLIDLLLRKFHSTKVSDAKRLINRWKNLGLVRENDREELELLPEPPQL